MGATTVAQDSKALYKKYMLQNKELLSGGKTFSMSLFYKLYDAHSDQKPTEQYTGAYIQHNSQTYFRINTIEMVRFSDLFIYVNGEEHNVSMSTGQMPTNSPFEIDKYLQYFEKVEYEKQGDLEKFTMEVPALTQLPYSKVEMYFTKKGILKKQVMYLINQVSYVKNEEDITVQPKMEVEFSNMTAKANTSVLQKSRYVKQIGKAYILIGKYKGYELINIDQQ
ncbi:MAG: hypothetical protein COA88_12610 [Kordia sp.]|nr:MAG: hypothetical protein COA88_12610 [Kordia sp.]